MSTKENARRILAQDIARTLFTNGSGDRAQRLVLELPDKRDGGGWCYEAAVDQIHNMLLKAINPPQ